MLRPPRLNIFHKKGLNYYKLAASVGFHKNSYPSPVLSLNCFLVNKLCPVINNCFWYGLKCPFYLHQKIIITYKPMYSF